MPRFTLLLSWSLLPVSTRLCRSPLPSLHCPASTCLHRLSRGLCCPASDVTCAPPTSPPPICPLLEVHFYNCMVQADCPLFVIQRLSAIQEQLMYCVYGNSGRYIDCCSLYGRCLLLGGSKWRFHCSRHHTHHVTIYIILCIPVHLVGRRRRNCHALFSATAEKLHWA